MKKTLIYFLILLITVVSLALTFLNLARSGGESSVFSFFTINRPALPTAEERIWQAIDEQIQTMTVEEKVGQLFMIGFGGKTVTPELQKIFLEKHWGGVILLGYNLGSSENIKTLIIDLQAISKIPLFISIDQEGGSVSRLKNINSIGQREITNEVEARQVALERGEQLQKLGFNVNYAPVLDFVQKPQSFLYDRVFRGNLTERGILGSAMVESYQSAKIIPVIKHFPGHPDDQIDSHKDLPRSFLSKETVLQNAQNFKDVLNGGPMMVMSGHIVYPLLDEQYPSSLSKVFLSNILRSDWGYDGVIITDDLEMGALQNFFLNKDIARLAFLAGNDILLYNSTLEKQLVAYDMILQAVLSGEISNERLNESVKRILFLKNQIFNLYD